MASRGVHRVRMVRRVGSREQTLRDSVVVEEPMEVRVANEPVAVIMRTPGDDFALAAGFLFTEGILRGSDDLGVISYCPNATDPARMNIVDVRPTRKVDLSALKRNTYATSSCGICGKASIERIHVHVKPIRARVRIPVRVIRGLPAVARKKQEIFNETGALHAAALFDPKGSLINLREDVGRHNAVDKIVGAAMLKERLPLERTVLLVSGRASFEIIQKAAVARIPVVCAVSAPTSLAIETARSLGMTLVGLLRGNRMNVYCGGRRLTA